MASSRRLEYLKAIGVDVWVRRNLPPDDPAPVDREMVSAATAAATVEVAAQGPAAAHASEAGPVADAAIRGVDAQRGAHAGAHHKADAAAGAEAGGRGADAVRGAGAAAIREADASAAASSTAAAKPATSTQAAPAAATAIETVVPVPSPNRVRFRPDEPLSPEAEVQWSTLQAEVLSCTKCSLHATRTQGVFGVGNKRAEWLIIGEAPGAEEDRRGEPFVGRAGQLLNAMLLAIGLPREQVFIANILKSRPPNNRDPKPEEVAACLPFLMRQIALLQPRLMLAVGRIAAQNLLATDMALGRLRGQVHYFGELNTPLIVTYHPAYLLRSPADKRKAWEDLKFARSTFQRLASQES